MEPYVLAKEFEQCPAEAAPAKVTTPWLVAGSLARLYFVATTPVTTAGYLNGRRAARCCDVNDDDDNESPGSGSDDYEHLSRASIGPDGLAQACRRYPPNSHGMHATTSPPTPQQQQQRQQAHKLTSEWKYGFG